MFSNINKVQNNSNKHIANSITAILILVAMFFYPNQTHSQSCPAGLVEAGLLDIATCNATRDLKCTSKDLEVVGAFLGDGCTPCSDGASIPLKFQIRNTTGSFRTAFAVWATLEIKRGGAVISNCEFRQCVEGVPANTETTITALNVSYTCGDIWTLKNVLLAWTDAADNSTCAAITCRNVSPKCGRSPDITIVTPVGCNLTPTTRPCEGVSNGIITATGSGGVPPYKFRLGSVTNSTGVFSNLAAGSHTVTINDSDPRQNGGCTSTCTVNLIARPKQAAPSVTFTGPSCTQTTFSVQVNAPLSGTYILKQINGNTYGPSSTGTFNGLTLGQGYSVTQTDANGCVSNANVCGNFPAPAPIIEKPAPIKPAKVTGKSTIIAAPNPYNDKIVFTIKSEETGQTTLELYNLLGQSIKTIFKGNMDKGEERTIEYDVPAQQRSMLIYLLKVGEQKISGKLIGFK